MNDPALQSCGPSAKVIEARLLCSHEMLLAQSTNQPTRPVGQNISSQTLTSKKVLSMSSLTGIALSHHLESDLEQHSYPSFPAHHMKEE